MEDKIHEQKIAVRRLQKIDYCCFVIEKWQWFRVCYCSVPQFNTEGHPVCAPTPIHLQTCTVHRVRGLLVWSFSIILLCRLLHSIFGGSPFPENEVYVRSLPMAEDNPHTAKHNHLFFFYCSLNIQASFDNHIISYHVIWYISTAAMTCAVHASLVAHRNVGHDRQTFTAAMTYSCCMMPH